ncbi:MAG: methyltransferase [Candidatus Symbiothrix sp.]|nr:methyltransferase [Candidatus Symbiothrix sp.]
MKVGTDGVLLGAWTQPVIPAQAGIPINILDIGTGSGLIALMLAQKTVGGIPACAGMTTPLPHVEIDAIDIDENAYKQTVINFKNAPFKTKLNAIHGDFRTFAPKQKYDLIVSNPPFFVDSLPSPDEGRTTARHTNALPFSDLIQHSAELLNNNGRLVLILPFDAFDTIQSLAEKNGLTLTRKTAVKPKENTAPNRMLLEYRLCTGDPCGRPANRPTNRPTENELTIRQANGTFSDEYMALTKDFYLNFPE